MKIPTDLKLLDHIYKEYYDLYCDYEKGDKTRSSKIFVPININKIAKHFKVDPDIIFGRLYYYLDPKYSYKDSDNIKKAFFILGKDESEKHCINFPLMSSILAGLLEENKRFSVTTTIAIYATIIAALSVIISLVL